MKYNPLSDKDGMKVRRQYFNIVIFIILAIMLCVPYSILVVTLLDDNLNFVMANWLNSVKISFLVCFGISVPFIIASVLNRYYFGKIVCVVNEHGVYYEDGFIYWYDIEKIEYTIAQFGTHISYSPSYVEIYTKEKEITINHAPLYLLSRAKKLRKDIKVKLSRFSIWCFSLCLIVFLALPFLALI